MSANEKAQWVVAVGTPEAAVITEMRARASRADDCYRKLVRDLRGIFESGGTATQILDDIIDLVGHSPEPEHDEFESRGY